MLFNSLPFRLFFALFTIVYYSTRGSLRLWVSLLASYFFYACWDWRFLSLLGFSTAFEFLIARQLEALADGTRRKQFLALSLTVNLSLLGIFKYFNFFVDSARAALNHVGVAIPPVVVHLVLPVGISFYTFQTMSYAIDVYRREVPAEKSLLKFAVSVALFVHLVAGPIVRARHLLPQLQSDRTLAVETASAGFEQALWGFFKKVVVADSLAGLCDRWFQQPSLHDGTSLLIAAYFYAFQIYCDFSGYTDIALGCAKILGYDLGVNFDRPYFSTSFREFWTRWHISLSSWLRDYLYISLGGNRGGTLLTYRNLMVTMLLGGLWHGASWTFVVWGALHGSYLVLERLVARPLTRLARALRLPASVQKLIAGLIVFHLVCFAWIFFRAPNFAIASDMIVGITTRLQPSFAQVQSRFMVMKGLALVVFLVAVEGFSFWQPYFDRVRWRPAWRYAAAAILLWAIALLGTFAGNAFIYFQF
jgi:alginate O-acetyltransferase complex protein AlgI